MMRQNLTLYVNAASTLPSRAPRACADAASLQGDAVNLATDATPLERDAAIAPREGKIAPIAQFCKQRNFTGANF
jgi:hypothetical protein